MDKQELALFKGSPLVNLAMKMGGRIIWVGSVAKVSKGSTVLAAKDKAKPRGRSSRVLIAV